MNILPFLAAVISALALENAVFIRALGLDKSVLYLNSPKRGILYGGILTWVLIFSSLLASLSNYLLADVGEYAFYLRAPAYFLGVCVVYLATHLLAERVAPALFVQIRPLLPFAAFNSALFGVFYITYARSYPLWQALGYAIGTGLGYTLALLVIYGARKRLALSQVPRSFRGLPILLVYLGLLSLALFGLLGHGLPF